MSLVSLAQVLLHAGAGGQAGDRSTRSAAAAGTSCCGAPAWQRWPLTGTAPPSTPPSYPRQVLEYLCYCGLLLSMEFPRACLSKICFHALLGCDGVPGSDQIQDLM